MGTTRTHPTFDQLVTRFSLVLGLVLRLADAVGHSLLSAFSRPPPPSLSPPHLLFSISTLVLPVTLPLPLYIMPSAQLNEVWRRCTRLLCPRAAALAFLTRSRLSYSNLPVAEFKLPFVLLSVVLHFAIA